MIWILSYLVFCLALAYVNHRLIAYGKRIYHALNGLLHAVCWGLVYMVTESWLLTASLPFMGRAVFDSSLSLMRGLSLDYVAKNPKSIIDQMEKGVFGNDGILPKVIYLTISIILIIVYETH